MLAINGIMFYESALLTVAVAMGAILLGQVAGSLCYRVAWRLVQDQATEGGGSACPSCGRAFSLSERIPVLGWLKMRGACPACGSALPIAAPASELLCGLVFASIVLRHGFAPQTLELLALACVLMVVAFTSLRTYQIPNGCIAAAVAIRVAYLCVLAMTGQNAVELALVSLVGACALGIPFALAVYLSNAMLQRDITGMGTVKLVAVVGLYLGWQQGIICMVLATLLIVFVWLLSPAKLLSVEVEGGAHRKSPEEAARLDRLSRSVRPSREEDIAEPMRLVPFAPSIAIALWIMLIVGVAPAVWSSPLF